MALFCRHLLPWEADIVVDHHGGEGGRVGPIAAQHTFGAQIVFQTVEDKGDGQIIAAAAPKFFFRFIFEAIAFQEIE